MINEIFLETTTLQQESIFALYVFVRYIVVVEI